MTNRKGSCSPRIRPRQVQNPAERLHMAEAVRMAEAIVFASAEPVSEKQLAARLPDGINIAAAMADLQQIYARRGVNLVRVGDAWAFRTAGDLAFLMSRDTRSATQAVARGARSAGDHRLPPAGDARRDRGHQRRRNLERHARHAAGNGMGAHARPPQNARPSRHLRHDRDLPRPFRAGGNPRSSRHGGTEGRRPAFGPHAVELLHPAAAGRSRMR